MISIAWVEKLDPPRLITDVLEARRNTGSK